MSLILAESGSLNGTESEPWRAKLISGEIKWIVFDAVGTTITPSPRVPDVYCEIGRRFGSSRTVSEIEERFTRVFRQTERNDLEGTSDAALITSEAIERKRWERIVAEVIDDATDPAGCFAALFDHFAHPAAWRSYPDVPAAMAELSRRGIQLALASNFDHRLHPVCTGLEGVDRIPIRVISSEVGFRKPSRRFFDALLQCCGCKPGQMLMVGDDYDNDCRGALDAGITPVWIDRKGKAPPRLLRPIRTLEELVAAVPSRS
jgi:putative hydrolase of the HAD superfamily